MRKLPAWAQGTHLINRIIRLVISLNSWDLQIFLNLTPEARKKEWHLRVRRCLDFQPTLRRNRTGFLAGYWLSSAFLGAAAWGLGFQKSGSALIHSSET
jgi:hypothetical protein